MAKKVVYQKGTHGFNDFVYVDLLPDVKRARQFNMNVIIGLTVFIVSLYVLVFIPYSNKLIYFEDINGLNNDLLHELQLTREEFDGYEINLNNIAFEDDITSLEEMQIDLKKVLDDTEIAVLNNNGQIFSVFFHAQSSELVVEIIMVDEVNYSTLNTAILNLNWVEDSVYTKPEDQNDGFSHISTFTIGVDAYVE